MRTLDTPGELDRLEARLSDLAPDARRRWGRMSPHQMICHLSDAFRFGLGERPTAPVPFPVPAPVVRFVALRIPLPWPRNAPTAKEIDQAREGTPPGEFACDRRDLIALIRRFAATREGWPRHPVMGEMSRRQWSRWGYLHTHHHLRQFGV